MDITRASHGNDHCVQPLCSSQLTSVSTDEYYILGTKQVADMHYSPGWICGAARVASLE